MAKDIASGYLLVNDRTFQRFVVGQLEKLSFEIERALRGVRGDQPDLEDLEAIKERNRRISRLTGALSILRSNLQRRSRGQGLPRFDGRT
jgi:hypothetical protein